MTEVADLSSGAEFAGDYAIERLLSRGGMGAVYLALQKSTGRKRALKLMHPSLAADEKARERFTREARVGSMIPSEHVVEVIGAGVDLRTNTPWLAMELLEGEDLARRASHGPLGAAEAAVILKQVCHALAAAHSVGVVHRDLKPENIFLSTPKLAGAEVRVKVLDFGIAKVIAESGDASTGFIGTPAFMAPEQSSGEAITPAADVWALGLMTFQLLTGVSYWRAANLSGAPPMQVLREVASEPMVKATERAGEYGAADRLPDGFDAWFARATARPQRERFANASEAWGELAPLLGTVGDVSFSDTLPAAKPALATGQPPPAVPSSSRWRTKAAIAAQVLLLVGVALAATMRRTPATAPLTHAALIDSSRVFRIPVGDSPVRGAKNALVTIIEYGSLECPYTRAAEVGLTKILTQYPDEVRVVWKHLPMNINPDSLAESRLALARTAQPESFWTAHDLFFARQEEVRAGKLEGVAGELGFEPAQVKQAFADQDPADAQIRADLEIADALGIDDMPYVFVNGHPLLLATNPERLESLVTRSLAEARAALDRGAARDSLYETLTRDGITVIPRPRVVLPAAPPNVALERGQAGPQVVEVYRFCNYTSWLCIMSEPLVRRLIAKYAGQIHYVFWDVADPTAPDPVPGCAATHASGLQAWRVHDRFLDLQRPPAWPTRTALVAPSSDTLRDWALDAGAESAVFDYGITTDSPFATKQLLAQARALGVDGPAIVIDGERYLGSEPESQLEQAIDRALKARATR